MKKTIIAIFIAQLFFSVGAIADLKKKKNRKSDENNKYNKAKARCLSSNPNLQGSALQKCITGKNRKE